MLVDVFSKGVRGKEAEAALDQARITVNKNTIPFDPNPPLNPSGIRLGSPAVTTRGFREPEMREVAALIAEVLHNIQTRQKPAQSVRSRVETLTERFPLYQWKLEPVPRLGDPSRANRHRRPANSRFRHRHVHSEPAARAGRAEHRSRISSDRAAAAKQELFRRLPANFRAVSRIPPAIWTGADHFRLPLA